MTLRCDLVLQCRHFKNGVDTFDLGVFHKAQVLTTTVRACSRSGACGSLLRLALRALLRHPLDSLDSQGDKCTPSDLLIVHQLCFKFGVKDYHSSTVLTGKAHLLVIVCGTWQLSSSGDFCSGGHEMVLCSLDN